MSRLLPVMLDVRRRFDDSGRPVRPIRRRVLHFDRFIEYGVPLTPMQMRETLLECPWHPARGPCLSLPWVARTPANALEVSRLACNCAHTTLQGWRETEWGIDTWSQRVRKSSI